MIQRNTALRRVGAALLAVVMLLSLAACGKEKFDASGYVDAALKLYTTGDGEALKAYAGKAVTVTEKKYDQEISSALEAMVGASGTMMPDSVKTEFKDMVKSMLGSISYTVGESKELTEGSAEGYEVPVTIKPLQINIKDDLNTWAETFKSSINPSEVQDMSKLYEQVYTEVASLMKKAVEKKEYGEETTLTIPVTKNQDGLYEMDQTAFQNVMKGSFATDITDALG